MVSRGDGYVLFYMMNLPCNNLQTQARTLLNTLELVCCLDGMYTELSTELPNIFFIDNLESSCTRLTNLKLCSVAYCNSKIFVRVLFSQNFADAKFRDNKTLANGELPLSLTDVVKSCPSCQLLTWQI